MRKYVPGETGLKIFAVGNRKAGEIYGERHEKIKVLRTGKIRKRSPAVFRMFLFLLGYGLLTIPLFAQETDRGGMETIRAADLGAIIDSLCRKEYSGRLTASPGQKEAAGFIARKFESFGLEACSDNSYFDRFPLISEYWGEVSIRSGKHVFRNFQDLIYASPVSLPQPQTVELVFGGYGTPSELERAGVEHRLVIVFTKNLWYNVPVRDELEKRGAFGVIYMNPENNVQFESMTRSLRDHFLRKKYFLKEDRSFLKARSDLPEFLASNTLLSSLYGCTAKGLEKKLKSGSFSAVPVREVQVCCEKRREEAEAANVCAFLKGTTDQTLLVSAHYDHLGGEGRTYFPGADDNASGVAAMLELAEAFSCRTDLKYNLLFLATTGEELGMLGSSHFAERVREDSLHILLNLNIDMLGRTDSFHTSREAYIYPVGTDVHPSLRALFRQADDAFSEAWFDYAKDDSDDLSGWYHRSDQYSFYRKGIPAVLLSSGEHPDYHTPRDIPRKINEEILEKRVKLLYVLMEYLQTAYGENLRDP